MKSQTEEICATKKQATKIFEGYINGNFDGWYHFGDRLYAPIGVVGGVEKRFNRFYFQNFTNNNIYPIRYIECATMDEKQYFVRLWLETGENLFIPIR